MTDPDKILRHLQSIFPNGATNAQIAQDLNITARETVFTATRKLLQEGRVRSERSGWEWMFYALEAESAAPPAEVPQPQPTATAPATAPVAGVTPAVELTPEPLPVVSGEPRLIGPDDLYGFRYVSDPQLSPDGSQLAYVLTHMDKESDEYRSAIYVVPSDGSTSPRRYTYGPKKDTTPRWSPDGSQLLFVSDREDKPQAYVLPAAGGEARKVTSVENGIASPAWSPDGSRIAFISTTRIKADEEPKDIVAYHYTEAHFKDDGQGIKRGRDHLFVQHIDNAEAAQLTQGDDDYDEPAWSPDGSLIAVVSEQGPDRTFVWASDIFLVPSHGGVVRRLTTNDGPSFAPSFSPDGRTVAYFGHQNPPETGISTNTKLWRIPVEGGEPELLTGWWDRSISSEDVNSDSRFGSNQHRPVWSTDGSKVFFLATDRGCTYVYSVTLDNSGVRVITSAPRTIYAFSVAGDRLAYFAAELLNPGDLYSANLDGSGERRLTRVNEDFLHQFSLSTPQEVRFSSTEQAEIQGWVMQPARYEDGQRYPLIIEVHGGPHTAYGHSFFLEFQVLAARGYGVLFTNPRGSTGYGQDFTACIVKQWGVRDYQDVMAAADWAANQPWVDPERIGITGGSYGGFMTNWVLGHTDRFKAGVTSRCLSNWSSFYGTSDIGPRFSEWMVGGTPWDNPEGYARMSPITYMKQVKTPLLVIHSEQDHRCPVEQGEQVFVALSRFGCETEFVRFPQESHGLTRGGKPNRRVENLNHVLRWFERYIPVSS